MKAKMIDPPSGWQYGFPKPLPDPNSNIADDINKDL